MMMLVERISPENSATLDLRSILWEYGAHIRAFRTDGSFPRIFRSPSSLACEDQSSKSF